jgi:hypothetical protein
MMPTPAELTISKQVADLGLLQNECDLRFGKLARLHGNLHFPVRGS